MLCLWHSQEVRGSIPGLAAMISEIGYLLLPSRDMAEIPLKRRKILNTTIQAYGIQVIRKETPNSLCCGFQNHWGPKGSVFWKEDQVYTFPWHVKEPYLTIALVPDSTSLLPWSSTATFSKWFVCLLNVTFDGLFAKHCYNSFYFFPIHWIDELLETRITTFIYHFCRPESRNSNYIHAVQGHSKDVSYKLPHLYENPLFRNTKKVEERYVGVSGTAKEFLEQYVLTTIIQALMQWQ